MTEKTPQYGSPGQKLQPPATFKEWPAKVLKSPQKLPGQASKKPR